MLSGGEAGPAPGGGTAGHQTAPVAFRVVGDTGVFLQTLADGGFTARVTAETPAYATVTLFPGDVF